MDLQGFLQGFPNPSCFCPSFSKQFFGGFVGFQKVTRVPNLESPLPNLFAAPASFWTHFRRRRAAFRQVAPRGVERVRPKTEGVFVANGGGRVHRAASIRVESKHHSSDFGFPKEKNAAKARRAHARRAVRRRATMNAAVNSGILKRHVLTTSFDRQLEAENGSQPKAPKPKPYPKPKPEPNPNPNPG